MTDVFHHERYPGSALKEFYRVLAPGDYHGTVDGTAWQIGLWGFPRRANSLV